jgi:hypothetical protein
MSLPVLDSVIAVGFVLYLKWKLHRKWWFLVTMTVVALFHGLVIWSIPWTEGWKPAALAGAIVSADICLILWIVATVEAQMNRPTAAHSAQG